VVVDDLVARAVEALGQEALGHRQADRVGNSLAERAGGDLHAGHVTALGMAGRARAPLPEALQILDREVEAGQMSQRVLQDAGVTGREHEAVAVAPSGVARIDAKHMPVEGVGQRRQGHRRARMARVCLLHRVHRQRPDRVDRELADLPLLIAERGCVQSAGIGHCRHMLRS